MPDATALTERQETGAIRILQAASATSAFDRFAVSALLVSLAADLGEPLGAATAAASAYFLCYGLSQPLWGLASDRLGRVRTMRVALALAAVFALLSALAPGLPLLVLARACTGACMAAVVPTCLVYVGDAVPLVRRQRTLTDINAATATGITLATGLGGVLAATLSWRVAFAVPGVAAAVVVAVLARLPEPPPSRLAQGGVPTVLRSRWGVVVLVLALVEGAALLGLLTYLAPALEDAGWSARTAGPVVALYGLGLLLTSRVVKRVAGRTRPEVFLAAGAAGLVVAYTAVAATRSGWAVGGAAVVVGAAWAGMHSTMQTWATEVVPQARASMVSLFAGALFVGSGVATAGLSPLADAARWPLLFGIGGLLAAAFGAAAVVGRARYPGAPGPPDTGIPPVT
ncbi:MAG TPA: MFS transporter [Mycobacteriales bacterium]|nr:MFS transporter [Mycobacteriales bacterium]